MEADQNERERDHDKPVPRLDWKDYAAITIAAFETTFLPIIILMLTLIAMAILFVHLWKP